MNEETNLCNLYIHHRPVLRPTLVLPTSKLNIDINV